MCVCFVKILENIKILILIVTDFPKEYCNNELIE